MLFYSRPYDKSYLIGCIFTRFFDSIRRYYPLHSLLQQAVKQLLVPVLPKFVEAFLEALQSSDEAVTDTGIKTDIMKALTVLLKNVPSHMGAHFKSIVMCIWQLLVNSSQLYPFLYITVF